MLLCMCPTKKVPISQYCLSLHASRLETKLVSYSSGQKNVAIFVTCLSVCMACNARLINTSIAIEIQLDPTLILLSVFTPG